jgi:hypothetical protein
MASAVIDVRFWGKADIRLMRLNVCYQSGRRLPVWSISSIGYQPIPSYSCTFASYRLCWRGIVVLFVLRRDEMMTTVIAKPPRGIARPICPTCGTRMSLVRIFPDSPGYDQRTYECPRCAHEIAEIVKFQKVD